MSDVPWRDPRTGMAVYRPLVRRTRLQSRSAKLAKLQRLYTKMRRDFITDNPWCIRCGGEASQVHHAAGRVGADLLRVETWRPVCGPCHAYIGDNPTEAYERGWSLKRIGAAS